MQVKQRLRINWMVPAISMLAVIVMLSVAVVRVQRALETAALTDALLTASFERLILRTDLLRTGNERSRVQWTAKHAQIGALLTGASNVFQEKEDRRTVRDLIEVHESIGKVSAAIDSNRESRRLLPPSDLLSQQMEARLLSQLNMKLYETILLNRKLSASSEEAVKLSLMTAAAGILVTLLLVTAVTLFNSTILSRTLSSQIARLRRGAALIGGGDLDHRIAATGDDEFVELAQGFNEMTSRLHNSYQSLEKEIEERKQAEKELRQAKDEIQRRAKEVEEREQLLSAMMDNIPIGITIADAPDVSIRAVNRFGRQLTGGAPLPAEGEEGEGGRSWKMYHADGVTPATREELPLDRATLKGELVHEEVWVLGRADGGRVPVLCTAAPIRDADGNITGGVVGWQDITERLRVEEELRRATEAAEAANRTKSQFLANMSHELRTPMTGVLGMLQLALEGPIHGEEREYLEAALKAGRSLLRIINDILDLTKVESGKLVLQSRPFDLRKCVSETAAMLIPEARRKGIEVKISLGDDLPAVVEGDQVRLRQIVANLGGNAVKFTEQGEVEIKALAGERRADGTVDIAFTVKDSGIGIPEDKKHLLFNYFSQVDDTNTRGYGGTGLGLAISRMLVEGMGGTIGFESEEGKGSTFCFTLPFMIAEGLEEETAAEALEEVEEVAPPAVQVGAPPPPCGKAQHHLLVAEDDATIRQLLGTLLNRMNFATDFAENGEKAVQMWQQNEYDLILMDVQMPIMDGFSATRSIRKQEEGKGRHIPIIAMTAHAMKEDAQRCFDAGMDRHIPKPINFKECLDIINELLNGAKG